MPDAFGDSWRGVSEGWRGEEGLQPERLWGRSQRAYGSLSGLEERGATTGALGRGVSAPQAPSGCCAENRPTEWRAEGGTPVRKLLQGSRREAMVAQSSVVGRDGRSRGTPDYLEHWPNWMAMGRVPMTQCCEMNQPET